MRVKLRDLQWFALENDAIQPLVCCHLLDKPDMARRRKSDEMRWQIVGAVQTGLSFCAIAAGLGTTSQSSSRQAQTD